MIIIPKQVLVSIYQSKYSVLQSNITSSNAVTAIKYNCNFFPQIIYSLLILILFICLKSF